MILIQNQQILKWCISIKTSKVLEKREALACAHNAVRGGSESVHCMPYRQEEPLGNGRSVVVGYTRE